MTSDDFWTLTDSGERAFRGAEPQSIDRMVGDFLAARPYLVRKGASVSDPTDPVVMVTANLDAAVTAAEAALDDKAQAKAEAAMLENFQKQNPYAPDGSAERALEKFRRDWTAKAAGALTPVDRLLLKPEHVGKDVTELKPLAVVEAAERAAMEPPDVVKAWSDRAAHSAAEYFQLVQLDVQLSQHFAAELRTMPWEDIRDRYAKAVTSRDLRDVAFVQAVERASATGALNRPGSREADLPVLKQLGDLIRSTRESRIPEPVRALKTLIDRARNVSTRGHEIKGLKYWEPEVKG